MLPATAIIIFAFADVLHVPADRVRSANPVVQA